MCIWDVKLPSILCTRNNNGSYFPLEPAGVCDSQPKEIPPRPHRSHIYLPDPFRHNAGANSHGLHPWGNKVVAGTDEVDALYAKANSQYMYNLWYSDKLAPYMATELLKIQPLAPDLVGSSRLYSK